MAKHKWKKYRRQLLSAAVQSGKPLVYIVGRVGQISGEAEMFLRHGYPVISDITKAGIVVLTGGSDIHPELYGEAPLAVTHPFSSRDWYELSMVDKAPEDAIIAGICRGGQLLHVLNGNHLWQHVDNHQTAHDIVDVKTGEVMHINSVHHQQFRFKHADRNGAVVVATASVSTRKFAEVDRWTRDKPPNDVDYEVLWYPNTHHLCFQAHPEYARYIKGTERTESYFFELLQRFQDELKQEKE